MSPHPLFVLAAGLLTFASPCILPLTPVYLGLVVPEDRCPATVRELLAEQPGLRNQSSRCSRLLQRG